MRNRIGLPLLAAFAILMMAAPLAHAGTYTVLGCALPSGAAAPLSGWHDQLDNPNLTPFASVRNECPSSVYMSMTPTETHPNGSFARETFIAPAGTTVQAYTLWRAVRLVPRTGFYYQALADADGIWTRIDGCAGPGQCGTYGNYQIPTSPANHFSGHPAAGTTQLEFELVCANSNGCPKVAPGNDALWFFHTAVALEDNSAPYFTGTPSGPLVSDRVLSGVQSVSLGASDQGGGVYLAKIELDGRVVQTQVLDNSTGTCQTPFVAVVPCPPSANGTIDFNTAQPGISDGTHSLSILVTDPAGNTATWNDPTTITTDNNPCSPAPAASGMTLNAAIVDRAGKRPRFVRTLTVRRSQHPTVVGSLTGPTGAPVAGAPLCVATVADYPGAPIHAVASMVTSSTGTFSYRLRSGPSRTVYIIHRVPGGAIAAALKLHVHVPVTVNVNARRLRNGQVMTWTGKLPGPAPNGLIALMQVWRGSYWETFRQIGITRSGRWVGRYRFTNTTGVQSYVFRLLVPHQSLYPYAAGRSRLVRIVVTG